jgi:hypothetical protein
MCSYEEEVLRKIDNKEEFTEEERRFCAFETDKVDFIEGESGRWDTPVTTIFKLKDRFFGLDWFEGLTENQDDCFFDDPYEVERKEKVVTKTVVYYINKEEV